MSAISDTDIRMAALDMNYTFLVDDILYRLGMERSSGTKVWHILRDMMDEGLLTRDNSGYTVVKK